LNKLPFSSVVVAITRRGPLFDSPPFLRRRLESLLRRARLQAYFRCLCFFPWYSFGYRPTRPIFSTKSDAVHFPCELSLCFSTHFFFRSGVCPSCSLVTEFGEGRPGELYPFGISPSSARSYQRFGEFEAMFPDDNPLDLSKPTTAKRPKVFFCFREWPTPIHRFALLRLCLIPPPFIPSRHVLEPLFVEWHSPRSLQRLRRRDRRGPLDSMTRFPLPPLPG